jgi:hypothetical protein
MAKNDEIVVFMHDGQVISNDPRWNELSGKDRAKLAKANFGIEPDQDDSEENEDGVEGYDSLNADQLKAELKARQDAGREIDTKGIKKKADLVAALEADDEAQASESEEDDEDADEEADEES